MSENRKEYTTIDVARMFFCVCIVFLHSGAYHLMPEEWLFQHCVLRLAVPFFFVTSGFFLGKGMLQENGRKEYLIKYEKRLLYPYVVFSIINTALSTTEMLLRGESGIRTLLKQIRAVIFYPNGALWYIWACMIAAALLYLVLCRNKLEVGIVLGTLLYLAALLMNSYYFLTEGRWIRKFIDLYLRIAVSPRNGIFVGFLFMGIGVLLAKNEKRIEEKNTVRVCILLALLSYLTLIAETVLIQGKETADDHSLFLSFLLLIPAMMVILLHYDIHIEKKYAIYCRNLSAGIYYLHRASLACITVASLIMGFKVNSLLAFLIVLIVDALICIRAYRIGNNAFVKLFKYNNGENSDMAALSRKFLGKISRQQKQAFIFTAILMVIVHFYAFANMIVNHDCVNSILGRESTKHYIELGRWAILPFLKLSSDPVMPSVIGLLSTLYVAAAAVFLVSLWEVRSGASIFLMCAALSSFPVLANTFCYMYTADAYFAALLLAVFYAWLMKRNMVRYFIPGIAVMSVVCGIYQAYWCLGMVLLLAAFFLDYVYGKDAFGGFVKKSVGSLVNLAASLAVYYGIARAVQTATGLSFSAYQDLDRLGQFGSVKEIYWYARAAYFQFLDFFFVQGGFLQDRRLVGLNVVIMLIMVILLAAAFYRNKRKWYEQAAFWCLLVSIPVVINELSIISRNRMWPVMMIAFVLPYLIGIACCERSAFWAGGGTKGTHYSLRNFCLFRCLDELYNDKQNLSENGACL